MGNLLRNTKSLTVEEANKILKENGRQEIRRKTPEQNRQAARAEMLGEYDGLKEWQKDSYAYDARRFLELKDEYFQVGRTKEDFKRFRRRP